MRQFAGIDLGREPVPDETTVCKFRHLLEQHELGTEIFATVNAHLESLGLKVGTGTIVDATIISAPSSTKNATKQRDPEIVRCAATIRQTGRTGPRTPNSGLRSHPNSRLRRHYYRAAQMAGLIRVSPIGHLLAGQHNYALVLQLRIG